MQPVPRFRILTASETFAGKPRYPLHDHGSDTFVPRRGSLRCNGWHALTLILLIRHASHALLGRELCGRRPGVSLNEQGRNQAAVLAERLDRLAISAIHASPMERATETAAPLAARKGLMVTQCPAINEIDFGEWMGAAFSTLSENPAWTLWNSARGQASPPGGEAMVAVQARVAAHLRDTVASSPDGTIAMISHGDVIKSAVAFVLGLPLDAIGRFDIDPASITSIEAGDWGFRLTRLNEVLT